MNEYPLVDLTLAKRLEQCEAETNVAFIDARAALKPETGAVWMECNGTYALFDGPQSPLTQTFGLGLFSAPSNADLELIEPFFTSRGAAVFHEVSPLASPDVLDLLARRGYHPVELSSVMYQPIGDTRSGTATIRVRRTDVSEADLWAATAAKGWTEFADLSAFMLDLGRVTATSRGMATFIAEADGGPIATGAVAIHNRVALLAGASTVPSERKRGAQKALLEARLQYAGEQGCDLAMMVALPGSASQRNAERQGFRIAYTRIKWGHSNS